MPKSIRVLFTSLILGSALLLTIPVTAQPSDAGAASSDPSTSNVLLTVRIGRLAGADTRPLKSYDLVVVAGGVGSTLLSGARVPIPTTTRQPHSGETEDGEVTAFVYQNVGFSTEARAWILDDDRIKLAATIEDSRVREDRPTEPPTVETRQLSIHAILRDGVPLQVTRVEGMIEDQSGFVEIEAKILR